MRISEVNQYKFTTEITFTFALNELKRVQLLIY